ncbi:hypothetical protein Tco_0656038 [Tanacetum coccineum]|uniref:Uncharacterized protein n=1 Tax=Tanacetum coccineum TaxID=301880 RepID=A0ABQ4X7N5_9ASTR
MMLLLVNDKWLEKLIKPKKLWRILMGSGLQKIHVCITTAFFDERKQGSDCVVPNFVDIKMEGVNKIESILEDLRWHATRRITDGVLRHPVDSQAWRTIDEKFPEIAEDTRNLRLGISADGVDVNTGNRHHKPLVDDLHTLFEIGVDTYDASTKDNFNLCDVVLWTINDYPALGTLCGCPYSGFKEKNVAESIVETILHVPGKTKDRLNARLDLAELGVKPELFAMQDEDKTTLPLAGYTLTNAEKDIFCETLHNIKVPEGYCSNFSSLVNLKDRKLIGLKSPD